MTKPEPDQTPRGPAYEGRLLPRPEEEVVDQGLTFDVGTLFSRRRVLAIFGVGAGMATLAACGVGATSCTDRRRHRGPDRDPGRDRPAVPGRRHPTALDVLEQSGIVRQRHPVQLRRLDHDGGGHPAPVRAHGPGPGRTTARPFAGVAVYVWHCDRAGLYSMYSEEIENENYLRGVQVADADGKVTLHQHLPRLLLRPLAAHPLRGLPRQASITDATNVHRHLADGAPEGRLRRGVRHRRATSSRSPTCRS